MSETGFEKAFEAIEKEAEILRSRSVCPPEIVDALKRLKVTLFSFGFYDPPTKRDMELARLMHDDIGIVFKHFHI